MYVWDPCALLMNTCILSVTILFILLENTRINFQWKIRTKKCILKCRQSLNELLSIRHNRFTVFVTNIRQMLATHVDHGVRPSNPINLYTCFKKKRYWKVENTDSEIIQRMATAVHLNVYTLKQQVFLSSMLLMAEISNNKYFTFSDVIARYQTVKETQRVGVNTERPPTFHAIQLHFV